MMQAEITLLDIKTALKDAKFREKLPKSLDKEVQKFLQNPSCTCNFPIYEKVLKDAAEIVREYYPNKKYKTVDEKVNQLSKNNFTVINCSIGDLEKRLKLLPPGRKQIAMSRFEDQITVIVNELEIVY
jgi:hypothetical protein